MSRIVVTSSSEVLIRFDESQRRIGAALTNSLALWEPNDGDNRIPYSFSIPEIAREIALIFEPPRIDEGRVRAKLLKAKALALKLLDATTTPRPSSLVGWDATHALATIADMELSNPKTNSRGAPKRERPARIADVLLRHFQPLTGKKADGFRDGQFAQCLGQIYNAVGLPAKAEYQARQAIERFEKS